MDARGKSLNVYLATLGCRLNEAEIALWKRELLRGGDSIAEDPTQANLFVVNTCAVTEEAVRKSRKLTARLRKQNPSATIALTGCFATLEKERAEKMAGVDLVVSNGDKNKLVQTLRSNFPDLKTTPFPPAVARAKTRAFLKVQDGCRNRCTFCIVTIARGQEISSSPETVVEQVARFVSEGFSEVVLTGVHLGGYGVDLGTDLVSLVRKILKETSVERLRLSSLEPWDLPADFFRLWDDPRLMPHLHLPLQSGCDSVLKRMARRCPTEKYRDLVATIRENIPDLTVTTDLIVGFPNETEDEHARSMEFVESMEFTHMHVFPFSRREGTTAARMSGDLQREIKRRRCAEAIEIGERMRNRQLRNFSGDVRPVLFEHSKVTPSGKWVHSGYTDNYLRVICQTDYELPIQGTVQKVKLGEQMDRSLSAELL